MAKTASHLPSAVCDVRKAAKAVPAASARGSKFARVLSLSLSRPEKTRDRTMLSAHAIRSGVTDFSVPTE